MSLSEIEKTIMVTRSALDKAWDEWATASDDRKQEFKRARIELLKGHVGPVEPYLDMNTSGTTGAKRSYRFGPCGWAVQKLHEKCALDGWDPKSISLMSIVINHNKPGIDFFDIGMMPWHESFYMLSVHPDNVPQIPEALASRKDATGLQPSPGVLTKLIAHGLDLRRLDPLRTMFVNTGEKPIEQERLLVLEHGFQFHDHMRCWDGGFTFYTCRYGHKHLVDILFDWYMADEDIVSSDLFNAAQKFIDYRNGDKVIISKKGSCACGRPSVDIVFHDRKISLITIGDRQINYNQLLFGAMASIERVSGIKAMDWYNSATAVSFAHHQGTIFMLFDGPCTNIDPGAFNKAMIEQTKVDAEFVVVSARSKRSAYKTTKMFEATNEEANMWRSDCANGHTFESL